MIQYFVSLTRIPSIALLVQVSMQQKLCLETAVKITSCVHTGRWPVGPGQRLTKRHFIPAAGTAAKTTSACAHQGDFPGAGPCSSAPAVQRAGALPGCAPCFSTTVSFPLCYSLCYLSKKRLQAFPLSLSCTVRFSPSYSANRDASGSEKHLSSPAHPAPRPAHASHGDSGVHARDSSPSGAPRKHKHFWEVLVTNPRPGKTFFIY